MAHFPLHSEYTKSGTKSKRRKELEQNLSDYAIGERKCHLSPKHDLQRSQVEVEGRRIINQLEQ